MIAIEVKNVSKSFKNIHAVSNLSFQIRKSTCFGLLGPNGAGKTTMMKMIFGKTMRDNNKNSIINVFGNDPVKNELEIKFISGIVPQEDNLDLELNVIDNLLIYSKFYGINKNEALMKIKELLKFMELSNKSNSKIRHLSGGMKRRLVIARALLNNPKLLILDEPTTGLDPQVRHIIWDKLRILKNSGVTILITTHYMEEAFQLCDNLIMLYKGKKVLEGNPKELIEKSIERYVLELFRVKTKIASVKSIRVDKTENRLFLYSNKIELLNRITENLVPGDFYLRQANLEDLFLYTTGRQIND